ncbi:MAG: hypothetical protein M3Z22_04080 [Verrucomicrobiota bacterium]|nr:hypothetical protein [Verrucomicrobiota bacterium]
MKNLPSYLSDHLSGSVGALELLENLIRSYEQEPLGLFFRELRSDVAADKEQLEALIARLGFSESPLRKASAWILEKFSRVKLSPDRADENAMELFLALEALVLGINGKNELWRALAAASENVAGLRSPDYSELQRRAEAQAERVEEKRRDLARRVFAADANPETAG